MTWTFRNEEEIGTPMIDAMSLVRGAGATAMRKKKRKFLLIGNRCLLNFQFIPYQ